MHIITKMDFIYFLQVEHAGCKMITFSISCTITLVALTQTWRLSITLLLHLNESQTEELLCGFSNMRVATGEFEVADSIP